MAQVIDEIGQGFQALEQLLGSLDLAFQQLTEQFQASQTQLSNRTQSWSHGLSQVGQASCELQSQLQQIDGQLSTADQHWQALATSLHDWESQRELKLSQQAEPLQSKSQSLITQIESLHQECRARVQQLQPASQNLHQFESSSHSQFESDLQLAQLRLQKWQHLLEQSLDPLRASLSTTQELLAGMRKGLEQDARRTVPESLAPLQQWLKASLPQSLSDFRQQTLELVLQSFTQYQEGALARAAQFSNAAGGLYGGLIQLELQSLPSSVAEAFQQQAKPGVQKVSPEVSRARRSTQSADNIAREVEVFQGVIQFAFEYFAQQAAASGAVAPAPVGARIQPQKEDDSLAPPPVIEAFEWGATQQEENLSPNAPLFRPARGEEHLWVQRGDGSWVKKPSTPDEMVAKYGFQDLDPNAPHFEVHGQASEWVQRADGSWARKSEVGARFSQQEVSLSEASLAPLEEERTPDLPEVHLETRPPQTSEAVAEAQEAARLEASLEPSEPSIQEQAQARLEQWKEGNAEADRQAAQPLTPTPPPASPASHASSQAASPGSGSQHQTLGGFEDNTREVYEKMKGGQNTPPETLEKLRQETIARANHGQVPAAPSSHPSPTSHASSQAASPTSGSQHQTLGGFEDNTREVYEKMRGGQNTAKETLEKLRQETIARATHGQPASAQHPTTPHPATPSPQEPTSHKTLGGFEDNTREVYEKMKGGRNTPKETLEKLRQETMAKAHPSGPTTDPSESSEAAAALDKLRQKSRKNRPT